MRRIYLDNAATTTLAPEVLEAMVHAMRELPGNPSSIHGPGREARRAVDRARRQIADAIGATPPEIYFTSGGSESDNWALKGAAFAGRERGRHLIISSVEHHAILHTCDWLKKQGFEITRLPVDHEGRVSPKEVEEAITPGTILISVMMANNEIGTMEPVEEIGRTARAHGIPFHTDAVQAAGAIPIDVRGIHADMLSLSAHKFHGPKGVGILYVRDGIRLESLVHGGAQERGLRAGTENVPGIVGAGMAMSRAVSRMAENTARILQLRKRLSEGLLEAIPGACLNGPEKDRLPNNCHLSIPGVDGEALLLRLDLEGIAASGGSACTSGSLESSHVLRAIGQREELAKGSIRLTLSDETTEAEIDEVLRVLPAIVADLRALRGMI